MRKDMLCALHANSFYAHSKVFAVHERRDAKEVNTERERKRERFTLAAEGSSSERERRTGRKRRKKKFS